MIILETDDVPPSPNVLKRKYRNPHAYKRLRTAWELLLVGAAPSPHHRTRLREQAKQGAKLWVEMTFYHVGTFDPDNLAGVQKVVLDALVNIGFLGGDSLQFINLLPAKQIQVKRKDVKTIVKIGAVD